MAGSESIRFDFTSTGADRLASDFRKTGDSATLAARGARQMADMLGLQSKTARVAADASLSLAKAQRLLADEEEYATKKTVEEVIALDEQKRAAQEAARANEEAAAKTGLFGDAAGGAVSPMVGLGAAAAGLAPIAVTLGIGLAGVGLAAAGVISPVLKAAQSAGGLRKAWATLDPEQRAAAQSLLKLKADYTAFQESLQPEILTGFAAAVKLGGHILHDVQPVAAATGKAFDQFIGNLDATLNDTQWKSFWAFMARTAPQDMALLGASITNLVNDLPQLLEQLQPLGRAMLLITADTTKLVGGLDNIVAVAENKFPLSTKNTFSFLHTLDAWTVRVTDAIPGVRSINDGLTHFQHWISGSSTATAKATPLIGALGQTAYTAATRAHLLAADIQAITSAAVKGLTPLLNYTNAEITTGNDAKALSQALKKSHDAIGLNTAAQRASFSAANTYISDLISQAQAAMAAHKGINAQITSIQNALPLLESAKTKNRAYWQEVKQLVNWLGQLKNENVSVHVTGYGKTIYPGVTHAAGTLVPAGFPNDTYPALLTSGETVVPRSLTPAVAPLMKAHGVPGFAAGGLIGPFAGSIAGLDKYEPRAYRSLTKAIVASEAAAIAKEIRKALQHFLGGFGGGFPGGKGNLGIAERAWMGAGGPGGMIAHIAGAIAGAESSWNPRIVQAGQPYATTGWGAWQITPGNSEPQFGVDQQLLNWHTNALAAVAKYHGAGSTFLPWTTFVDGAYLNFMDRGGYLRPGWNMTYNGTGRPERVLAPGQSGNVNLTVNISMPYGANPDPSLGRDIAQHLTAFIRRGGRLYPAGVTPA